MAKKAFPNKIKIFHSTFDLVEMDLQNYLTDPRSGSFSPTTKVISYLGTNDGEMVDTIIHEAAHGIHRYAAIHLAESKDEEYIVSAFASGMTTVMRDNIPLFRALLDVLEKDSA